MYNGTDKFGGGIVGFTNQDREEDENPFLTIEQPVSSTSMGEALVYKKSEDGETAVLSATIDPQTGSLRWTDDQEVEEAYNRVISTSQMTSMLNDKFRNESYYKAISQVISDYIKKNNGKQPIVLDIGTGTGLLAMMSSRSGAKQVYACELFEAMSQVAQKVIASNQIDNIQVFAMRSSDLEVGKDFEEKADILVTEIFDSILLGEAVIPSVRHAKAHVLKEGAKILPQGATVFAQLVECDTIKNVVNLAEKDAMEGVHFARDEEAATCRGNGLSLPIHASKLPYKALSQPVPILSFDFQNLSTSEEVSTSIAEKVIHPIDNGTCHAILFWWDIALTDEVHLCTVPGSEWWQDHWLQMIYPLPKEVSVSSAESIKLSAIHNDFSIWFDVKTNDEESQDNKAKKQKLPSLEPPICYCGFHLLSNYERTWMLGDAERNNTYRRAIENSLNKKGKDALCLDVGDGSLCALLAAGCGAQKVISLELQELSEIVFSQVASANDLDEKITILNIDCEELCEEDTEGEPIRILVAEPFFYQMQNYQITQAIAFWYKRTCLSPLMAEDAIVLPAKATIRCVAVQLGELWRSHSQVGVVSGFDHQELDKIQKDWHDNDYVYPLWMYDHKELSERFDLLPLHLSEKVASIENQVEIPFKTAGTCHTMVMWMDYHLDEENVVSNGPYKNSNQPSYWKSTFRFLPVPETVLEGQKLKAKAVFDQDTAQVQFSFEVVPKE